MLKIKLIFGLKSIISLLILLLVLNLDVYTRPILKFSCGYTYDFGNVKKKDSPLKADIVLYNKGTDTLKILKVKPMCGCTTAPLNKNVIAPGDSALLKVTLNVEHYEGEVNKKISFSTNFMTEEVFLTLRANVYQPISLFPGRYFNFAQMFQGDTTISKIVLNNLSGRDITITNVVIMPDDVTLNLYKGLVIPKDSDYVIEATCVPMKLGPYSARFDVYIDDPDMPVFRLSGFGSVGPKETKEQVFRPVLEVADSTDNFKLVNPPDKLPTINIDENSVKTEPIPVETPTVLPEKPKELPKPNGEIKVIDPKQIKKLK